MSNAGGCLCGNVSYSVEGKPVMNFLCHCKNCQKQSGSAFSINLIYPKSQFKLQGELSTYVDTSKLGRKVLRHFCSNCGSPIFSSLPHMPGIVVLKVGTLDDTSTYNPEAEIWCVSKQNWADFKGRYPEFKENPPT